MKSIFLSIIFLLTILASCEQPNKSASLVSHDERKIFVLDSSLEDSIRQAIQLVSDRHSSLFKTPIVARFFSNDVLIDSIVEPDFKMSSWYSIYNDTIDLVAHISDFETSALLLRFVDGMPQVFFFRAPHSEQKFFRIKNTDSFSTQIEVPPNRYKLILAKIPDAVNKQIIFGSIDMESTEYFEKRGSVENRRKIQFKFYFRSQYKGFPQ